MPWYSVNTSIIIQRLRLTTPDVKQVWLADDHAAGGKINSFCSWYKHLSLPGKKVWLHGQWNKKLAYSEIMQALTDEAQRVFGEEVNITTDG